MFQSTPVNPPTKIFRTAYTEFAIHEVAADRLKYLGCDLDDLGRVQFCFDDTNGVADEDLRKFQRGISQSIPVHYVFVVRSFLLNEIKMKQSGAGNVASSR